MSNTSLMQLQSLDSSGIPMYWFRADGSLVHLNASARRLMEGGTAASGDRCPVPDAKAQDFLSPMPGESWEDFWDQVADAGNLRFASMLNSPDGDDVPADVSANVVTVDGEPYVFVVAVELFDRSEAEKALRRSESIQRSIMVSSTDIIMLLDRDQKIQFINRTAPGFTPAQVMGTEIYDYILPETHKDVRDCFRRVESLGEPDRYQVDLVLQDGSVTTWESRVAPVWTEGRISGFTVNTQDITERRRAESALRESELMLARAQKIARMGSWEYDLVTEQRSASAEMRRILGCDDDRELPTMEGFIQGHVHPDDQALVASELSQALARVRTDAVEFRILRGAGTTVRYVRAEAEISLDDEGKPRKLLGTLHDLTEQKEVVLALRESEQELRVITERSPAIVLITRADRIIYCNAMLPAVSGYTREELLEMNYLDLVHPRHREATKRGVESDDAMPELDPERRSEVVIVTKSGDERWLDLSRQRFIFEGAPAVLVTSVEVSERKAAEHQLREMESQLAHVSRLTAMGEMVAGIAHEINQPLSAIANYALACHSSLSSASTDSADPIEDWLREINLQAVRCGDIVRGLRDFVRKNDDEREVADFKSIVRDSVRLIEADLSTHGITLKTSVQEPSPCVDANPVQLQQVLVNLLRNACDATRDTDDGEIRMSVERIGDFAVVTVEDNGSGIESDQQGKLFDAFFTTKRGGMGMGLAISKSIADSHGGSLRYAADDVEGARFVLRLPATAPSPDGLTDAG